MAPYVLDDDYGANAEGCFYKVNLVRAVNYSSRLCRGNKNMEDSHSGGANFRYLKSGCNILMQRCIQKVLHPGRRRDMEIVYYSAVQCSAVCRGGLRHEYIRWRGRCGARARRLRWKHGPYSISRTQLVY